MHKAPLASSWDSEGMVASFARSSPNPVLVQFAAAELLRVPGGRVLDIGCGAARNAVPLAKQGWHVLGVDRSWPMLVAAVARSRAEGVPERVEICLAPMERLPVRDRSVDLLIAHGIWNLAASSAQFRGAVREAARVARPGAGLFVFTFSRNTFPPGVTPVAGEPFVFTEFSGEPQCFLTAEQLISELAEAGFTPDPAVPLTEYNRRPECALRGGGPPVIYECAFRYTATG
jgi:ubiquinone/menaquinone biosynthesis C-methylase UbiE